MEIVQKFIDFTLLILSPVVIVFNVVYECLF